MLKHVTIKKSIIELEVLQSKEIAYEKKGKVLKYIAKIFRMSHNIGEHFPENASFYKHIFYP